MHLPRHAEIWLPGYAASRLRNWLKGSEPARRVWFTIADHYEPFWRTKDEDVASQRVAVWRQNWPEIARRHVDSTGRPAQYGFFYPEEEYRPHLMERLAEITRSGFGDVEIHLHHDQDSEAAFIDRMQGFLETLETQHGLLRRINGKRAFGFIHGNWCLDNSRPDGRWCGLNNEITLLRDLGCYADFTMPSGPSPTQARQINQIYWATDDPAQPKSYDAGRKVRAGEFGSGDLLMIPGPFGLRWGQRRWVPRMEAGELADRDLATPYRIRRWLELAPRVGSDIFLKIHTHGTQESTSAALLGGELDRTFQLLAEACQLRGLEWRYVTPWEMRQAVEQAAGASGFGADGAIPLH